MIACQLCRRVMQDLAVVVLLMLIPLLAPQEGGSDSFGRVAQALGVAAVKVCQIGTESLVNAVGRVHQLYSVAHHVFFHLPLRVRSHSERCFDIRMTNISRQCIWPSWTWVMLPLEGKHSA